MRKKYLSALLFGALLFASAGTFTSCKDYDDDIAGLQEQINTVVADLNDLKALVGDGGVSSVTFDEATGVLTVVDAAGTHTYTIKTPADEVGEIKVTIDDERNLVVNDEVIGKVGDVVTVNEEGYLCVNGEATEIKAGKYAILENVADNMYTISLPDKDGNMQTIQLLRALPTDLQIVLKSGYNTYTNNGIYYFSEVLADAVNPDGLAWGTAVKDVDWAGPKGAVKKGQLLVGQQNVVTVGILPSTTELDTQTLKLIDSEGNYAPVTVVATPHNVKGLAGTGSRAKDSKGEWDLQVVMTSDVTKDNIGSTFATDNNTSNKLYALSVNGVVLTDHVFVIDTDTKAFNFETATGGTALIFKGVDASSPEDYGVQVVIDGEQQVVKTAVPTQEPYSLTNGTTAYRNVAELGLNSTNDPLPVNKAITLKYIDPSVYDYQFVIAEENQNDAEKYGIKVENNVLTASNAAATLKDFYLDVILMGVDGNVVSYVENSGNKYVNKIKFSFGESTVDAEEIAATTYKLAATDLALNNQFIKIDLGTTFSALTAEQATSLETAGANAGVWSINDGKANDFLLDMTQFNNKVTYYSDEACTKKVNFPDDAANIKNIKYALIPVTDATIASSAAVGTETRANTVKPGDYSLTLTLKSDKGEVKKVKAPVTIQCPTFDDLFTKSAAWADDAISIRLDGTGKGDFYTVFTYKGSAVESPITAKFDTFKVNGATKNVVTGDEVTINAAPGAAGTFTITSDVIDMTTNSFREIPVEVSCLVQKLDNFEVKEDKAPVKFLTALDGAKIVNYTDGVASSTFEIEGSGMTFKALYKDDDGKKQGVALIQNGQEYLLHTGEKISEMLSLDGKYWFGEFGTLAGSSAKAAVGTGGTSGTEAGDLIFTNLSTNAFTEDAQLKYPAVKVGSSTIYTPITITLQVNGGK